MDMLSEYKVIFEIMKTLRQWIKSGMVIKSTVALFHCKFDGKYITRNKSDLLFEYIIENLKKYQEKLYDNQCNDINYIENQIKFLVKFIDNIRYGNASKYQINSFFDVFKNIFVSSHESGKYKTIKLVPMDDNDWGISASGLFSILYNFYYSNIEVISCEEYTKNRIKYFLRFNIHNPYIATRLDNEFFAPMENEKLRFGNISKLISSILKKIMELQNNNFPDVTYIITLCNKAGINFESCLTRQILVNVCEMMSDTIQDTTKKLNDRDNLHMFYDLYINEDTPTDSQKMYYENKTKLRKYCSFKEKMQLYGKKIDIKNVTDFSYPFYKFGMENRKLFLKTESKLFNSKFREICSCCNMESSGAVLYFLEEIFCFHSIYILARESNRKTRIKNLETLKQIKEDISPIMPIMLIYMSIVIENFRPAEKWMTSDEWNQKINSICKNIMTLEEKCTMATVIQLLYISSSSAINKKLLGERLSKESPLDRELYNLFKLCDVPYTKPQILNLDFYRTLKKIINTNKEESNNIITQIEETLKYKKHI